MSEKESMHKGIIKVLKTINKYLENDKGAIELADFTDDFVIYLVFRGACVNCKKNNTYLEKVIEEMIKEAIGQDSISIKYID